MRVLWRPSVKSKICLWFFWVRFNLSQPMADETAPQKFEFNLGDFGGVITTPTPNELLTIQNFSKVCLRDSITHCGTWDNCKHSWRVDRGLTTKTEPRRNHNVKRECSTEAANRRWLQPMPRNWNCPALLTTFFESLSSSIAADYADFLRITKPRMQSPALNKAPPAGSGTSWSCTLSKALPASPGVREVNWSS